MKLLVIIGLLVACFLFTAAWGHHDGKHERNNGATDGNVKGIKSGHDGNGCLLETCRITCRDFISCVRTCQSSNCIEGEDNLQCGANCIDRCSAHATSSFLQCQTCIKTTLCMQRIAECRARNCASQCPAGLTPTEQREDPDCKQCLNDNCVHIMLGALEKLQPHD